MNPLILQLYSTSYTYLHSHCIFSQYLYQFLHHANSRVRRVKSTEIWELQKSNRTEVAYISKERSKEHSRASHARPFLCDISFSFSFSLSCLFYRFVWDSISLTRCVESRVECDTSSRSSLSRRAFLLFSVYHENVPVSKSLTTSKARRNKLNIDTRDEFV